MRKIVRLHQKHPMFGLDSIYNILRKEQSVGRARVHRLMKHANIHSLRKKAYKTTTSSNHKLPVAPNLLQQNFTVTEPKKVWVSDITYIKTKEGWLYLAIIKDLCTRKIVGYAFSNRIDTSLVISALHMAYRREKPLPGLIHHSDRGVQYAAIKYQNELERLKIIPSMSRKGNPYDNAVAENFFSCLKCELVHLSNFNSGKQARNAIFSYIEAFYNSVRPHSALGWTSPNEYAKLLFNIPSIS